MVSFWTPISLWGISDDREPKTLREKDVKARTIKSSFPLNILHLRVRNLVRESGMMEIGRKQEVLVNLTQTLELISMAHQRLLYSNSSTSTPIWVWTHCFVVFKRIFNQLVKSEDYYKVSNNCMLCLCLSCILIKKNFQLCNTSVKNGDVACSSQLG